MKFKRLVLGGLGLSVLAVLSACAFSGKEITHIDFKEKTFKESSVSTVARIEYSTVNTADTSGDISYDEAYGMAVGRPTEIEISYYDSNNKIITNEYADSIQNAITQSHGLGATLYYPESKGSKLDMTGKDTFKDDGKEIHQTVYFETLPPEKINRNALRKGDYYDGSLIAKKVKETKRTPIWKTESLDKSGTFKFRYSYDSSYVMPAGDSVTFVPDTTYRDYTFAVRGQSVER